MWLFGQLDTLGRSEAQVQTDESARVVGELLERLAEKQEAMPTANDDTSMQTDGTTSMA